MTEPAPFLVSYGRRRGRKLRVTKQGAMDTLLPKLTIALDEANRCDPRALFPKAREIWLEIGFGGGEHLAYQAALHSDIGIIGCEPYINGVADLLRAIDTQSLNNIRLFTQDARHLIAALPENCIARTYVLYPDPWPKLRHRKRRLVAKPLLDGLARAMQAGALLRMATDDADYCAWMLEHVLAHGAFRWTAEQAKDWLMPWEEWHSTKYEKKALAAGRLPSYLEFEKLS